MPNHILTKNEYDALAPRAQGYFTYMRAEWPGHAHIPQSNPHPPGSKASREWNEGANAAMLHAQDSEE